jgi:hypothetical protein
MNTLTLTQQEQQFEFDLSYKEHLRVHNLQPSDDALNDMERVFCKATILKHHEQPLNNIHYNNL